MSIKDFLGRLKEKWVKCPCRCKETECRKCEKCHCCIKDCRCGCDSCKHANKK